MVKRVQLSAKRSLFRAKKGLLRAKRGPDTKAYLEWLWGLEQRPWPPRGKMT